ncbi:MAG: CocE/NonD family hydrolase [Desulfovibrio sp.]|nr:MAG: CocE/NonD family hydrolase [Desulfovibrio sp.]
MKNQDSSSTSPVRRKGGRTVVVMCVLHIMVLVLLGWAWTKIGSERAPEPTAGEAAQVAAVFGGEYSFPGYSHQGVDSESMYLEMRDGEHIAVEVYLPGSLQPGETIPAIIKPTRYWRRWQLNPPVSWFLGPALYTRVFTASGYAVLSVDARGSGASTGVRPHPWSEDEVEDYREVIDWVLAQEWSNGLVGASGISYGGTCAEFMASLEHPALKAVAPRFSLFDTYADIAFPGGVFNEQFVLSWGKFNGTLDAGCVPDVAGWMGKMLLQGVAPVACRGDGGPCGRFALEAAFAEHADNLDIYAAARRVDFRDEFADAAGTTVDGFSPHGVGDRIERGRAAIYGWSGWHDGAYAGSVLKRYMSLSNPQRAVIGPWNHAATQHTSPYLKPDAATEPNELVRLLELRRFFDFYLKGEGTEPRQEIVYYTMGEEVWKSTPVWPPQGVEARPLYLARDTGLAWEPGQESGQDDYTVEYSVGSGDYNRWKTQLSRSDVHFLDFASSDGKRLVYTSAPLEQDTEITGTVVAHLHLATTEQDGAVFAYLEEIDEAGQVRVLTEGMLRLTQRGLCEGPPHVADGPCRSFAMQDVLPVEPGETMEVRFGLLPVSVLVREGRRLRLALAGGDADQFARLTNGTPVLTLFHGPETLSRLELPVVARN